ncbi:hypothetical protein NADE_001741 [Nannochloris sp. 'desiccata']|nr:hypothetical protein NADE_001741 [Chlorella desiccata (nom. nud.)]
MHLLSRGQLALGTTTRTVGCRLVCKGPASRPFYGRHAILASTSLATGTNSAAAGGAAPTEPGQTEAPRNVNYTYQLSVNSAAVWGIFGLFMCGIGVWLCSPQMLAKLGKDGIIGCITLVIGALGIYKGDMDKLKGKIDNVHAELTAFKLEVMTKLNDMSSILKRLDENGK